MPPASENFSAKSTTDSTEKRRKSSGIWSEFLLAGGLFALFTIVAINLRESLFVHEGWLFGEPSWGLWVVDKILQGKMIYRDASFSYGVLPTFYIAGAASIFGSTAHTIALFGVLPGALSSASAIVFLRRAGATPKARWLFWALMVAPALWHSATNQVTHSNFETAFVVTILALLRPAGERSWGNAMAAGVLMGLLNLTKFGSFVGIGLAVIALDSFRALALGWKGKSFVAHVLDQVVRPELMILCGFLCIEIPRLCISWFVFPPEIWRDYALFPLETLKSYNTLPGSNWDLVGTFRDSAWGYRIGTMFQKALLIATVFCGGAMALVRAWKKHDVKDGAGAMVLLSAIWFGSGFLFFYHHLDHLVVYSTPLVVPAAAVLLRINFLPRLLAGTVLCLCTSGVVAGKLLFQKDGRVQVAMPNGETIWFKEKDKAVYEQISSAVNGMLKESSPDQSGAVFVWRAIGSGWHHFMGWPNACRHSYLISPEWIRPFERESVTTALLNSSVYLAKLPRDGDALTVTADRATWRIEDWLRVPAEQWPLFLDRLSDPAKVENVANCWMAFKVKPGKP